MAISGHVIREGEWGVKLYQDGHPFLLIDPDTAIRLGIHLIILGQEALHGKALEMVCIDKRLPADTFADLWARVDQYVTILNAEQKDVNGNDTDS
jgi:hypothetical protein